uniref:Raptor_N domain-containing protein n=1 Tax=Syphacia muris TaxID=451379 RepID=A0A0N5ASJ5_9BILA
MKTSLVDDTRTDSPVPSWFEGARHIEDIAGADDIVEDRELWYERRTYKERLKTVSYAVVMCLNLGIEPPDMMRRQVPCGKLECWVDPQGMSPQKAVQQIVKNIQATYERWQPRARLRFYFLLKCINLYLFLYTSLILPLFKIATDPTVDEVRRLCQGMRRNAKDERVLFHYNGHGVPKPTENGELWVFNTSFTQLEGVFFLNWEVEEVKTEAVIAVKSFSRFAGDQEKEWVKQLDEHMETRSPPLPEIQAWMSIDERASAFGFPRKPNYRDCIHLAACAEDEYLPIDPDLPADLFTSCLTTPIKTSILWHILKNGLKDSFPVSNLDRIIPGEVSDRRSILGELNWIFTAITDTIAWDALSKELFQKIFRLDLVLASLCRSFLLADRVMLAYNRHVVSEPRLPSLHDHPLWDAWDFTLDHCLDRIRGVALQNSNVIWNLGKELHFVRTSLRYNSKYIVFFML